VDFNEYRKYSRAFKALILEIAPLMEDRGVDEVYIDFTDVPGGQRVAFIGLTQGFVFGPSPATNHHRQALELRVTQ